MRSTAFAVTTVTAAVLFLLLEVTKHGHGAKPEQNEKPFGDISLWIDQQQIKMLSGFPMEIYAIAEGRVLSYLLERDFESKLPIIPSEVSQVNFTWKSGAKRYYYHFFELHSFDESILETPRISIKTKGRVPNTPEEFSVVLPCAGNSGIAQFGIGLVIEKRKKKPLNGTPLRLRLKKECTVREPNPVSCPDGYLGPPECNKALCYPNCMNNGNCTAPGVCSCPPGYQGPYCEGGICAEKCMNGGKCIQKDVCLCPKGYFGFHCEFSKCVIPCLNGGKCRGNNICKCPVGFKGNHCEIGRRSQHRSTCTRGCRNGICQSDNTCICNRGWFGKLCNKNKPWA
ncbi:protein shifted isoform X2 [Linepithema humile]|uniref:protein shifted isoform X2 n=1 Tax=Linepithema humile TaxID=83485 RepID=UPI000623A984|nr:PREDICTED: protein shifted-like isoform X2 [Linepithema humile]